MSVETINNIIGTRTDEYKKHLRIQAPQQQDEQFLVRCAMSSVSKENVKRMYVHKPEIRECLLKIYNNTLLKTSEYIDNELTEVCQSHWFDTALKVAEAGKGSITAGAVINLICNISADKTHPYEVYKDYFEEKFASGEDIGLVDLLTMKNAYNLSKMEEFPKDGIKAVADGVSAMTKEILQESIQHENLSGQKERLQEEIALLEKNRDELNRESMKAKEELESFVAELNHQKAILKEQSEREALEKLRSENERLKAEIRKLKGKNGDEPKTVSKTVKRNSFAFGRKKRINNIITMMVEKGYTPEKIQLIREAIDKGVSLRDIEEIIEMEVETGVLRESVGVLTAAINNNRMRRCADE